MVVQKIKQILLENIRIYSVILSLGLLSVFGFTGTVGATGSAAFLLSSGGTYAPGSTVGVEIYESAPGSDNVNAVQANLSYSSSLLTYESISINGPFTLCTQQSGGGGSVAIACAATSAQSGEKDIAKVTFKTKGSGTAHVSIAGSSNIDNTGGSSVWNGSEPSISFVVKTASTSSGGSTNTPTKPTTTTTTKTTTPPKTTTTTPPKTTTTTPTTNTTTTTNQTPSTVAGSANYTITVTGSNGQPINHAKVSLDSNVSEYTDTNGKATFSNMNVGTYNVTITAPGKKAYSTTITLAPNEDKLASAQLASNPLMNEIMYGVGALILIVLGVLGYLFYRKRHPKFHAPPISPADTAPPTVGGGNALPKPPASSGGSAAPVARSSTYTPRATLQTPLRTESSTNNAPMIGQNDLG